MTIAAVRLNHAVLFVSDLERALRFWTGAFGMEVAAREPQADAAFLRLPRSGNHHDLGLFGIGAGAPPRARGTVGLYHLAWQVDTIEELEEARRTLAELGAFTGDAITAPATAVIGAATAGIVVGEGVLTLWAAGDDEESVARVEQVLGSHLERFAQREALTVQWVRDGGAPIPPVTATTTTTTEESA